MHHPDICNIMLIIEDYFILVDDNQPEYQIEPIPSNSGGSNGRLGIKIKRRLSNGFIQAEINGENKDDDSIHLRYYADADSQKAKSCISIQDGNFCLNSLRDSIRTILKIDKISTSNNECDN